MKTHQKSKTRIYRIWAQMRTRCNNENYFEYRYYGGRGIKICKRWDKFENFYEDMFKNYKDNLTIDRIDFNGNYKKSNCRWATIKEQCLNKRMFKLSREKIKEIRIKYKKGEYGIGIFLAREYSVTPSVISEIINKKRNYGYY